MKDSNKILDEFFETHKEHFGCTHIRMYNETKASIDLNNGILDYFDFPHKLDGEIYDIVIDLEDGHDPVECLQRAEDQGWIFEIDIDGTFHTLQPNDTPIIRFTGDWLEGTPHQHNQAAHGR